MTHIEHKQALAFVTICAEGTISLQSGSTNSVRHTLHNDQAHIDIAFNAPKDQTIRAIGASVQPLDMLVSPSSSWAGLSDQLDIRTPGLFADKEPFRDVESPALTMLCVSHALAVVRQVSDRVAVIRNSRFVEFGPSKEVFDTPANDYTRLQLDIAPRLDQCSQSTIQF